MKDEWLFKAMLAGTGKWVKWSGLFGTRLKIDRDTVCRCTGEKVKDGTLVFESDKLKTRLNSEYPEAIGVVVWNRRWEVVYKVGREEWTISLRNVLHESEVIGNIHDVEA